MPQPSHNAGMQHTSRRSFLKNTAVSAAAMGSLALARSVHAAGNDVIKVGLIGSGSRGSGAALNAMNADPAVKLVSMGDLFMDRVKASRENLKKQKPEQTTVADDCCFDGFESYQKVIASGVDLVLIACASKFHPLYSKTAIDAGKHVFVEKPHAIDPPGVRMVLAASAEAKKKNLCYASGLMSRYHKGVREAVQRVQDGAIGDVIAMEVNFLRNWYQIIEPKPEWSELDSQCRNWYHFTWLSGDDVPQSLVHNIDRVAMATKEQVPVKCHGLGGRSSIPPVLARKHGSVFDHHAVVYQFASGLRMYANCQTRDGCYGEYSDILLGSKGRCVLWSPARIEDLSGKAVWRFKGPETSPYDDEHKEIVAAIRSGKPINDGEHAAHSTLVGIMGQIACYTGSEVTWEQAYNSNFYFAPKPEEVNRNTDPPVKPDEKGIYPVPIPGLTRYKL